MMARQPIAGEVLSALAQVPASGCGALVRKLGDGTLAGALLVERGRVCWAMSQRYPHHLTDILVEEQDTLTHDQLDELFAMCRRDHMPLGETLVAHGLVAQPVLHRALLRHTCEALDCLIRDEASPWVWIEHTGYGYNPMLTFSPVEVVTGVRALANPALTARALARLDALVRPGQCGFAVARTRGAKVPLAQLGCEALALDTLADLAIQADEVMAVAATVSIEVALAELGDLACASWTEDGLLFVLLCEGELAFNRLLAQVATMTINP